MPTTTPRPKVIRARQDAKDDQPPDVFTSNRSMVQREYPALTAMLSAAKPRTGKWRHNYDSSQRDLREFIKKAKKSKQDP